MATKVLQTIRNGMLAIGVCASLAGSLAFASSAEARVPDGDRVSQSARICGSIQDSWDNAKATRDNPNSTPIQRAAASDEMRLMVDSWYAYGCDKNYGRIARLEVRPPVFTYQEHLGTADGSSQSNPLVPESVLVGQAAGASLSAANQ